MAWTYVTTSDWRITDQEQKLHETAQFYLNDDPRKSDNVPCTLALLFGIKSNGICAQKAFSKEFFSLYLNFIKKFQFPNPKPRNYKDTINDDIKLAPLREIIKILYYLKTNVNSDFSYLTYDEICYFIFFNKKVAKNNGTIDYDTLLETIKEYRLTHELPSYIEEEVSEIADDWKSEPLGRSLREIIQILSFVSFIDNNQTDRKVSFKNYNTYEPYIKDVVNFNKYLDINSDWERAVAEEKYLEYLNSDFSDFQNDDIDELRNVLTPEWFREQAKKYTELDEESKQIRENFINEFGPNKLKEFSDQELLNKIFLNGSKDNLCYVLEYNSKNRSLFGSIKGGSSIKFGLYFSESWKTSPKNILTEEQAIKLGTEIRDNLVKGAEILEEYKDKELSYDLYKEILDKLNNIDGLSKVWILKYYQMIYPNLLPTFYNDYWINRILEILDIEPIDNRLIDMGQISMFIKECDISNTVFAQICYDYLQNIEEPELDSYKDDDKFESEYSWNRILFGAPGTGKSYKLKEDQKKLLKDSPNYERVTFHPDYSYANFVGTYKPVPSTDVEDNECITYKYVPGPFMRTLIRALKNKENGIQKPYLLIIEEINRANMAAVFGDIFQLLDRDEKGNSEYPIQASEDMRRYLASELGGEPNNFNEINIPNNMFIWATMNSADQGVYPMDTAFKRRWNFEYISIDNNEEKIKKYKFVVGEGDSQKEISWNALRKAINDRLSSLKINEDKLLGPYFISKNTLDLGDESFRTAFKNKVLMYLFEDAAKQKRSSIFSVETTKYSTICKEFDKNGIDIFCNEITSQVKLVEETSIEDNE